jgi:hypothetical protein
MTHFYKGKPLLLLVTYLCPNFLAEGPGCNVAAELTERCPCFQAPFCWLAGAWVEKDAMGTRQSQMELSVAASAQVTTSPKCDW